VVLIVPFNDNLGHNGWSERPLQSVTVAAGENTSITIDNTNQFWPEFAHIVGRSVK
jgi:hypothetical protein